MNFSAVLIRLTLKLPQRPRSAVMSTSPTLFHFGGLLEEGMDFRFDPAGQIAQHHCEGLGIGPEIFHALLGAPQFSGGHHVHGLGDLLGLFDRRDLSSMSRKVAIA